MVTDKEKAIGQLRLQLNGAMQPFHGYGHDVFIPQAVEEIISLSLKLHERLSGKDLPIRI